MKNEVWGRDDLVAVAAVRYCLGRMTYIVGDCCEWLIQQWPNFKPNARLVIQKDIEEAFKHDDFARKNDNKTFLPLGSDCDRHEWELVRKLWKD